MINIPIGEGASILQPYYDGGESYVGHQKYSLVQRYHVLPEGSLSQSWCAFEVKVEAEQKTVLECSRLQTDVSEYNRYRIFGIIPKSVHVALYCNDELVLDEQGSGSQGYTDSSRKVSQQTLTKIRYEFQNTAKNDVSVTLFYLGMLNDRKPVKNPYTEEWEGCFAEDPQYDLYNEFHISKENLESIRKKLDTEPYRTAYQTFKGQVEELMQIKPEALIARTVREYHRAPFTRLMEAGRLALCGQLGQDKEMLKMACRYALSLACCENWCADVMENAPGVTWHHRSFDESDAVKAICTVISLAGGVLSWHGRNLLYNAIITKGLPRMEADFMTMDYIYKCNQGPVFMWGYLFGLVTLTQQYPRYKLRYEEAKKLLDEMYDSCISEDGGYGEGANYWHFMLDCYLHCQCVISRYEKKTLSELVGDKIKKTAEFGLASLDEKARLLTINDSVRNCYSGVRLSALMYLITGKKEWAAVFHQKRPNVCSILNMVDMEPLNIPEETCAFLPEFASFESAGLTVCNRENIQFAVTGGPSNNTHAHCDKGSFLINVNGEAVVPDFCCTYVEAENAIEGNCENHSMSVPVLNGELCKQQRGADFCAPVLNAEYTDSVFCWKCDTTALWTDKGIKKVVREIISKDKTEYVITDTFEFEEKGAAQFRLNLAPGANLKVIPLNWEPVEEIDRTIFSNEVQTVCQKILTSAESDRLELVTKIVVNG